MEHISEIIKETVEGGNPITTGLKFLDSTIGGYYPGELTTICGEEDCGKTAFVVSQLNRIAVEQHIPALVVLNNMSRRTFLSCMAAYYCSFEHVNVHKVMDDGQHSDEVKAYLDILKNAPLYIIRKETYEESALTPEIEGMIQTFGIKIVFVDEASSFWMSEEQKSCPVTSYKTMAMKWNIPIVITACVWNDREGIEGMKPFLRDVYLYCDIHGSDSVIGLFRYDRHYIYQDEHGRDLHDMVNMEILKCKGKTTKRKYLMPWGYLYLKNYADREEASLKQIQVSGNGINNLIDKMDLSIVDDNLPLF
jgi:replicative DNA helicase